MTKKIIQIFSAQDVKHGLSLFADKDVEGTLIFGKDKFIKFISNKKFLPDSYTAFKNKIGLLDEKAEFISGEKSCAFMTI